MNIDKASPGLRGWILLAALAAAALTAGCLAETDRDNVKKGGDGGGGTTLYYYDTDIAPVLEAKCGGFACHGSPPGYGGTVSLTGADYADIVDKPAPQNSSYELIDTANGSAESYIFMKATGAPGIMGSAMPYLTSDEILMLADWIDQDPPAPETAP
jgi:hypothetical protein